MGIASVVLIASTTTKGVLHVVRMVKKRTVKKLGVGMEKEI